MGQLLAQETSASNPWLSSTDLRLLCCVCTFMCGCWGRGKSQKREWLEGKWTELRHLIKRCVALDQILTSMPQLTILYKMSHLPISAGLSLGKFCSPEALDLFVEGRANIYLREDKWRNMYRIYRSIVIHYSTHISFLLLCGFLVTYMLRDLYLGTHNVISVPHARVEQCKNQLRP